MKPLPRTSSDDQLLEVVHHWVRLLESERYDEAFALTDHIENSGWTSRFIKQFIEGYGDAEHGFLAGLIAFITAIPCLAQLSKEQAQLLLGRAGIATMAPIRAELCDWDNGNVTWDVLRQVAAMSYISDSDLGSQLSFTQRLGAVNTVTSPRATELHRTIVRQTLTNRPCSDESGPETKATWNRTLEGYKRFIAEQLREDATAPATAPASSASQAQ